MEQRRRAPRRVGRRTTLTLPPEFVDAAERVARELGTTCNDAVVLLAKEGAAARARRQQVADLADARRAAVEGVGSGDATGFPTPEELRAAMLAGRRD